MTISKNDCRTSLAPSSSTPSLTWMIPDFSFEATSNHPPSHQAYTCLTPMYTAVQGALTFRTTISVDVENVVYSGLDAKLEAVGTKEVGG